MHAAKVSGLMLLLTSQTLRHSASSSPFLSAGYSWLNNRCLLQGRLASAGGVDGSPSRLGRRCQVLPRFPPMPFPPRTHYRVLCGSLCDSPPPCGEYQMEQWTDGEMMTAPG